MCNNCNPCKYNQNNICENKNLLFYQLPTENICEGCGAYEPKYKKEDCIWYHKEEEGVFTNPDTCGRFMPDSLADCKGLCKHFCIEVKPCVFENPMEELEPMTDYRVVIEGVGKDVEVITNENGGKQSKTPMALHLVDPTFLHSIIGTGIDGNSYFDEVIEHIALYMQNKDSSILRAACFLIEEDDKQMLIRIAKVLQEGADKYEPNNWRLIPQEQHINHALIHLFAAALGDTQDNHIDHALCRLMMAYATKPSENFSYTEYKKE